MKHRFFINQLFIFLMSIVAIPAIAVDSKWGTAKLSVGETKYLETDGIFDNIDKLSTARFKSCNWTSSSGSIKILSENRHGCTIEGISECTNEKVNCEFVYEKYYSASKMWVKETVNGYYLVTVTKIPVKSISLNYYVATLEVGNYLQLKATVSPDNATNKVVSWASNSPSVAEVKDGKVTAKSEGQASITCSATDGSSVTAICTINVGKPVPVEDITVSPSAITLNVGDKKKLTATVKPDKATNKDVTWTSNSSSVTVSSDGWVEAKAKGNATITCKAKDGSNVKGECKVTVQTVPVNKITLDPASVKLEKGETTTIKVTVSPSNATNKSVSWSSNNNSIAVVSSEGVITAKAKGDCVVTCKANDGSGVQATCNISVTEKIPISSISFDQASVSVRLNKTIQLTPTILPTDATNKSLTWSSSNDKIATVNSSGLVTGKSESTCTIFCVANDGSGKRASCNITVLPSTPTGYFKAKTVEGVEMTFYGYSDGTCRVSSNSAPCIDINTSGKITIPGEAEGAKVVAVGGWAFEDCRDITEIVMPNSVEEIRNYAFNGCTALTKVALGNGVKKIDSYAFYKCQSLQTITGIDKLEEIGYNAFDSTSPWFNNFPDGLLYLGNVLYKFKGTIPDNTTINVKDGTTMISARAFENSKGLIGITIPQSVKEIASYVFGYCSNLTSITVASGNEKFDSRNNCNAIIETSTNSMIAGCKSTTFPSSVTSIGSNAFYGTAPSEVAIPNNIDSIAHSAFYFCDDLKSVIIGKGTRKVETKNWNGHAFFHCLNLNSIAVVSGNPYLDSRNNCNAIIDKETDRLIVGCPSTVIPLSVKSIGSEAFENYRGIFSVVIPDNVETIEFRAFEGLPDLHSIVLGKKVKTIGMQAFSGCGKLRSIQSLADEPAELDESAFIYNDSKPDSIYNNATLYVPDGSRINYMTTPGWNRFNNIIEGEPDGIQGVTINEMINTRVYDFYGRQLDKPKKGINIIGSKKVMVK